MGFSHNPSPGAELETVCVAGDGMMNLDVLDDVFKQHGTPPASTPSSSPAKKAPETPTSPLPRCDLVKGTLGSPDNDNPFSPVSICPERQLDGQHAMQTLVEAKDEYEQKRNTPKLRDPKATEFRHHCKHFFSRNPDTMHLVTPPKVASFMAHQFFREQKPQGWKKKGLEAAVATDFEKASQVAQWFNTAMHGPDGKPAEASAPRLMALRPRNGVSFSHMNQTKCSLVRLWKLQVGRMHATCKEEETFTDFISWLLAQSKIQKPVENKRNCVEKTDNTSEPLAAADNVKTLERHLHF